ncbi:uncharacterized protein LOC133563064 [Nerophis ophidion]|uniref:uncharacterized protein LOC133563064 n=1 Tax=Nerophis ophidion TaxID=159077 RepID=UPI002AE0153B|nr:uncharacterized protein LOC133563064 [Nerophis ophidion]
MGSTRYLRPKRCFGTTIWSCHKQTRKVGSTYVTTKPSIHPFYTACPSRSQSFDSEREVNNLELNARKTVEMIKDFRKVTAPPSPLTLIDSPTPISIVESFRFLGTTITQDLKWEPTISSLIKKAQQRMYFLRQLRKLKVLTEMLVQFYSAIIESFLTSSITVSFPGATVQDEHGLQCMVRAAEKVIGCKLKPLQDLFSSRTGRRVGRITADSSHPGHKLFSPIPSGRRLQSIQTHLSHPQNRISPSAIRHKNKNKT